MAQARTNGTSSTRGLASPFLFFIIICALLAIIPCRVHAATPDRTPEEVLSHLSRTFNRNKGFRADFLQHLKVPDGKPVLSKGSLLYRTPGKMVLHYSDPRGQILLLVGNRLAFYIPQNRQLLVKTMRSRHIPETPALLFASLGHLRKYFYIRPEQGGDVPGSGLYGLELIPRKPDRHLAVARIVVDMSTHLPTTITFDEFNGMEMTIDLKNLHPVQNVSNDSFNMVLPPGTTVVRTKQGF
ncbi:MAG: outer membrane lipoprotein carrier protein LolA [Nitrospirae bacterium]|jgi:outer membrane lipoprotein carrier protein|nr:outer membrane lipoprotein carrier protein LolA [Nitrospirota bacterium]